MTIINYILSSLIPLLVLAFFEKWRILDYTCREDSYFISYSDLYDDREREKSYSSY